MRDELNQYDMMEEKLRRELLKYEASFEPDDWSLMEEKLDEAEPSYLTYVHHPFFRFAAAALFLLSSLYGIESWITPYSSYNNGIYTSRTDNSNSNNNISENLASVDSANEQGENQNSSLTNIEQINEIDEKNLHYNSIIPSQLAVFSNNSRVNIFENSTNSERYTAMDNEYVLTDNFVTLAAHTQRKMLAIPMAIPYNSSTVYVEDITKRSKRRMPGKRTIRTKIRTSLPPTITKSNAGNVRVGLYTSADINFLDLNAASQCGTSSGIEVTVKPKKEGKFAFVSGVGYSRKKFKTKDVPNNPLMSFLNVEDYGNAENKNVTNTFTSEMEVIEVPLLVQYTLGKGSKKIQPYIEAGATAYIPINQHYTYQSTSTWDQKYPNQIPPDMENIAGGYISEANVGLEIRGEHDNVSTKPYLGIANVNAGVNLRLSERISVHVEGQVKSSIVKHKLDRSIPETELNVGLVGGNDNKFNNRKGLHTLGLQLGVSCGL
ncbi:MAG: outer membrane beta-barrel protein [Chitinophagales bacterium]